MDLDVDHYTSTELIELLGIEVVNRDTIQIAVKQKIKEYPKKTSVAFFKEIEKRLLDENKEEDIQITKTVEIKKGTINPDLKETIVRLINIDSAYRIASDTNTSDRFILELSEPLLNVVSISLYSLEVPQSWYTFTRAKGTTDFVVCVVTDEATKYAIQIEEGNYTTVSLYTEVVSKINQKLTGVLTVAPVYNHNTGILTLVFTPLDPTIFTVQLVWVDDSNPNMATNRYSANLGWLLGYRLPVVTCDKTKKGLIAQATSLVDVSGTKYIIISLEDYKTNRINRSIISINNTPKIQIAMPTYFGKDTPQYKTSATTVHALASTRYLTNKQIYTINAISDQTGTHDNFLAFDSSNAFAKVAVKKTDWSKTKADGTTETIDGIPGKLFVENGGPLALQTRDYFGPVDLLNLSIGLYDDKGNVLGLNGMDWSISLMVKSIYQH